MATYTTVQLVDDVDGKSPAAETVQFALDGASFEIDLTQARADKLRKDLQTFVTHARRVQAAPNTARRGRVAPAGRTRSRNDLAEIREWATTAGLPVSSRGRIAQNVLDAYDAR